MDAAARSPYRAPTFREPLPEALDDLVEVTVLWGDSVLSVAHLRKGEGFAWEGANVVTSRPTGWSINVPSGATAWVADASGATDALVEGASRPVVAGERVGIALGDVVVRVVRTSAPQGLPRGTRATGFAAGTAFLLALAVTGGALAGGEPEPGTVDDDGSTARAWIDAHVRAYSVHAPTTPAGRWGPLRLVHHGCLCGLSEALRLDAEEGAPASLELYSSPVDHGHFRDDGRGDVHRVRVVGVEAGSAESRSQARRVVLRNLGQVARCRTRHGGTASEGRLAVRFVADEEGQVIGAGVMASTVRSPDLEACVTAAFRRWSVTAPDHRVTAATVTFAFR